MKQLNIKILLVLLLGLLGVKSYPYDIAVKNDDGVTIYYNYYNDGKELEVTIPGDTSMDYYYFIYYKGRVVIPDEVTYMNRTRKVTSIDARAFIYCRELTSVTIGANVTSIGDNAFEGCNNLTSVTIGNNVSTIGVQAFQNCRSLIAVVIPNSVTIIRKKAFEGCIRLTSVSLGNNISEIGLKAFYDCEMLESVYISDIASLCNIYFEDETCNPISYAHHLYFNNKEVKDLIIPVNVTSIGNYAFSNSYFASVTIPNSVATIGEGAFSGCSEMTSLIIPNSVTTIGDRAFSGCSKMTSLIIPNGVTTIGEGAFSGCREMTSLIIPNSVTTIGDGAFDNCIDLTTLTLGNGLTRINRFVFNYCKSLASVTIPNSVTEIGIGAFLDCTGLTSLIIPSSVDSIADYAFCGCKGLRFLSIGKNVKYIGNSAFDEVNLMDVVTLNEDPPIITGKSKRERTFSENTFYNATLYVPIGTIDRYKSADGWKDFIFIEEGTGGSETPVIPETKKCSTPNITYQNGKLTFNCETEGAEFVTNITDADIKQHFEAAISLTATYNISVYATRTGYENSETVTATLCWIEAEPRMDGIVATTLTSVRPQAVLIQNNGNVITITGAEDGTPISIYDATGQLVGSAKASSETTSVTTTLRSGQIGMIKIGGQTVKVLIK